MISAGIMRINESRNVNAMANNEEYSSLLKTIWYCS